MTENLMVMLRDALQDYVTYIDNSEDLKKRFGDTQLLQLRSVLSKCNLADNDIVIDQNNKVTLL